MVPGAISGVAVALLGMAALFAANFALRVMLTYSSFFLGWGSYLLGAAIVLLPTPPLVAFGISSFRACNISKDARERVWLAAADMVPVLWYLLFANRTITHSSYMVLPWH
jgi:hypothetical protein